MISLSATVIFLAITWFPCSVQPKFSFYSLTVLYMLKILISFKLGISSGHNYIRLKGMGSLGKLRWMLWQAV